MKKGVKLLAVVLCFVLFAIMAMGSGKSSDSKKDKEIADVETGSDDTAEDVEPENVADTGEKTDVTDDSDSGADHQHEWVETTCTEPQTCSICGKTNGEPLGHSVDKWKVKREATCSKEGKQTGKCSRCGENVKQSIKKKKHDYEWVIKKKATFDKPGKKVQKCKTCGAKGKTKKYELTKKEKKEGFKAACKTYSYKEIARQPEKYNGKLAKFTGEVIQVMEEDDSVTLRVDITKTSWGYDDTILVYYEPEDGEAKILEDDIITMWGYLKGDYTYETVLGASMTVPLFQAYYVSLQ